MILQEFIAHTHELRAIRDKTISLAYHDFPNIEKNIPGFSTTIEKKIGNIRANDL
jgi:hypothetical protein